METKQRSQARALVVQKVAILFIYKYGWDWEAGDKPEAEDPDPDNLLMADQAIAGEGAEVEVRAAELKSFKIVSFFIYSAMA